MEMNARKEEQEKQEKGQIKKRVILGKLNDSITSCNSCKPKNIQTDISNLCCYALLQLKKPLNLPLLSCCALHVTQHLWGFVLIYDLDDNDSSHMHSDHSKGRNVATTSHPAEENHLLKPRVTWVRHHAPLVSSWLLHDLSQKPGKDNQGI